MIEITSHQNKELQTIKGTDVITFNLYNAVYPLQTGHEVWPPAEEGQILRAFAPSNGHLQFHNSVADVPPGLDNTMAVLFTAGGFAEFVGVQGVFDGEDQLGWRLLGGSNFTLGML